MTEAAAPTTETSAPATQEAPATPAPSAPAAQSPEERIAAVQRQVEAQQAAKLAEQRQQLEAQRAEFEAKRSGLESEAAKLAQEREAIAQARQLQDLAKSDPVAFFRATGLDPKDVLKRVEEGDRVSPLVKEHLSPLEKQIAEQSAKIDAMEKERSAWLKSQEEAQQQAAMSKRQRAFSDVQKVAKSSPEYAALAAQLESGVDEAWLGDIAASVVKEHGEDATIEHVAKAATKQLQDSAAMLLKQPWFAQLSASLMQGQTTPPASVATAGTPPKTITQMAASSTSGPPAEPVTEEEKLRHAAKILLSGVRG